MSLLALISADGGAFSVAPPKTKCCCEVQLVSLLEQRRTENWLRGPLSDPLKRVVPGA